MNRRQRGSPLRFPLGVAGALAIAGCTAFPPELEPLRPPSSGETTDSQNDIARGDVTTAVNDTVADDSTTAAVDEQLFAVPLTLERAAAIAFDRRPELVRARAHIEAALGRKLQVGTLPNPVLSTTIEGARFRGKTAGDAEYPIGIVQTVPLSGRLSRAEAVEDARHRQLLAELAHSMRDVERSVRGAFAAALFARDALAIERELLEGTREAASITANRVAAGDVARDQGARAELEAAFARLSLRRAETSYRRALVELVGTLGGFGAGDASLEGIALDGELAESLSLPELGAVLKAVEASPLIQSAVAEIDVSEARIELAEAARIPDLELGFFYRHLGETNDEAFDIGVGIELPLFDRRQGDLAEARADARAARAARSATEATLATSLRSLYWKLAEALETAAIYRDELMPRSGEIVDATNRRYAAGAISLAEVIPIQRDHRELRLSYLRILRQIAFDWAKLRELVPPITPPRAAEGRGAANRSPR